MINYCKDMYLSLRVKKDEKGLYLGIKFVSAVYYKVTVKPLVQLRIGKVCFIGIRPFYLPVFYLLS